MSDPVALLKELKAVRELVAEMDRLHAIGDTFTVQFELHRGAAITLQSDHEATRALLVQREATLLSTLRACREDIFAIVEQLRALE